MGNLIAYMYFHNGAAINNLLRYHTPSGGNEGLALGDRAISIPFRWVLFRHYIRQASRTGDVTYRLYIGGTEVTAAALTVDDGATPPANQEQQTGDFPELTGGQPVVHAAGTTLELSHQALGMAALNIVGHMVYLIAVD